MLFHEQILLFSLLALSFASVSYAWVSVQQPNRFAWSAKSFTKLCESASGSDEDGKKTLDIKGKDIYQRVFYRLAPNTEADIYNNIVLEERVRFKPDEARGEGYLKPVGPRTLILRDGKVEEGEIGDEILTLNVKETNDAGATHGGAGMSKTLEATIATILFVAANPKFVEGTMLEVGCELGLAGLLGCIGAEGLKISEESEGGDKGESNQESADDILTIPKGTPMSDELKHLTLTDPDPEQLDLALQNIRNSRVASNRVSLEQLDWRKRGLMRKAPKTFHTLIASDLDYTYPEAKELAHTVAHRLEAISSWYAIKGDSKSAPTFVHVCPEAREQTYYLNRFLSKGYRMNTSTKFVKLEKIVFLFQLLPENSEEEKLDDLELEVQEFKEIVYQSLTAEHHPDYAEGAGELFFPMETGEYDSAGGSTYLEPESGRSGPW